MARLDESEVGRCSRTRCTPRMHVGAVFAGSLPARTSDVEAMLHAVSRLRSAGYEFDLRTVAGGRLRCPACGTLVHGSEVIVTETVRFEGISNPEDQAILDAVIAPCGHRGLFERGLRRLCVRRRRGCAPGAPGSVNRQQLRNIVAGFRRH